MVETQNFRVGSGKFLIGTDAVKRLADEVLHYSKAPIVIGGSSSVDRVLETQATRFQEMGIMPCIRKHTGECSRTWASRYAEEAKDHTCGVVLGIGGGKCIDLAKAVATLADLPIITVPTSIATCVATSSVCIMYTDEGKPDGSIAMNREVDVSIADLSIILTAPKRLLFSGVFDSIAKLPETIHNSPAQTYAACGLEKYICIENSRIIYSYLIEESERISREYPKVDENEFKNLVLTNLLHTSIVSGFSLGLNQLAIAHGLYDFMKRCFTRESKDSLHGEIVAVGILAQMAFNGESDSEIMKMKAMMERTGIPATLPAIGFVPTQENVDELIQYLMQATHIKASEREKLYKSLVWII